MMSVSAIDARSDGGAPPACGAYTRVGYRRTGYVEAVDVRSLPRRKPCMGNACVPGGLFDICRKFGVMLPMPAHTLMATSGR